VGRMDKSIAVAILLRSNWMCSKTNWTIEGEHTVLTQSTFRRMYWDRAYEPDPDRNRWSTILFRLALVQDTSSSACRTVAWLLDVDGKLTDGAGSGSCPQHPRTEMHCIAFYLCPRSNAMQAFKVWPNVFDCKRHKHKHIANPLDLISDQKREIVPEFYVAYFHKLEISW
jgi:hypothetical protein